MPDPAAPQAIDHAVAMRSPTPAIRVAPAADASVGESAARRPAATAEPFQAGDAAPVAAATPDHVPPHRPGALPAPLLAPTETPHAAEAQPRVPARGLMPRVAQQDLRAGTPAAEAAGNEVHVHIGRIEVTAVREAPAARMRAAKGRSPMSLDEYLARRREGT